MYSRVPENMNERELDTRWQQEMLPGANIRRFTLRFAAPSFELEFQKHRLRNALEQVRLWGVAGIAFYLR